MVEVYSVTYIENSALRVSADEEHSGGFIYVFFFCFCSF